MTMTVPDTAAEDLPEMRYPMIMTMITDGIGANDPPLTWKVGEKHPLEGGMRVVAMYTNGSVVEVYSLFTAVAPTKWGVRNLVPTHHTRLIWEMMPLDVFGEELARSEAGDDDDDDDEPDPDPDEPPALTPPNVV
jgi:hypothetical protein